jgi:cytochrome P450
VTHLANVKVDDEKLPDDVIVSFFRQLLNAAGDTTYRGTTNILTGLLTNPAQLDAVRADPELIPKAIDEGLRWEDPSMTIARQVAHDVELGGVMLPAGSVVDVVIGSANRDAGKFKDPDCFDMFRERVPRPFPFGTGPHVCIGQHLAKVEMVKALAALFERLPNLRLDPGKPVPQITGFHLRTAAHLHVLFD